MEQSVEEYKEVYIKAKREFETVIEVSWPKPSALTGLQLMCPAGDALPPRSR